MEADLEQQIIKRLSELPADVRAAVESGDVPTHVHDIGAKHGLHVDQIGLLEDATMLVMLGFSSPADFVGDIEEQLHISAADAAAIADEIGEQLFVPIRESMQAFMEQRAESTPSEPPPQAMPVPAATETKHELSISSTPPKQEVQTMPAADTMLTQKTISTPTSAPSANPSTPTGYKIDPYREPPE